MLEADPSDFFQQNRLLFLPTEQVARSTSQLANAEPIIGVLAKDPSPRGLALTLSYGVEGLKLGRLSRNRGKFPGGGGVRVWKV
jgi:hypothetical protein